MSDPSRDDVQDQRLARLEAAAGITPPPVPTPTPTGKPAVPTGLAVVIGPDGAPVLTWSNAADATSWDVTDRNNPAKPVQDTVTSPRSVRSPLRPGSPERAYAVRARSAAGTSDWCAPVVVPALPASGKTPTPAPMPGGVKTPYALLGGHWYLTLPTGTQGSPDAVKMPALANHSSRFFELTSAGDGVVFRAWHGGVTTKGSPNPRSELRECSPDGSLAWWPMRTGRHAMTVEGQVNRLTKVRPHVVLHQIHGRADDTTVWRLEGTRLWITDGDNVHAHLVTDNLPLGQRYALTTEVADRTIRYRFNGDLVPFELNAPEDEGYFKVGAYVQSNKTSAPGESTDEYAEVVVFRAPVTHTA